MEELKQLIEQYQNLAFDFAECGSKKPSKISNSGEIIYEKRSQEQIDAQKQLRNEIDNLANSIYKKFREKFYSRQIPKNLIGADVIARYISKEDSYLYDYYYQICDAAFSKNDVETIIAMLQIMELPVYYMDPVKTKLSKLCSEVLPKITLSTGHDTSIYIENIRNRFCVLGMQTEKLKEIHKKGLTAEHKKFAETLPKTHIFGE